MSSQSSADPDRRQSLLIIIKTLTSLPAQILFYGAALLAIAATGGTAVPGALGTLATGVGMNVLANMLERVAKGDSISDHEIRKAVEEAIRTSGIEELVASNEFQRAIAHVFRRLDLLEYAIHKGEIEIAAKLAEQFSLHIVILNELQSELAAVHDEIGLLATRGQAEELQRSMQSVSDRLNAFPLHKAPTLLVDQKIAEETDRLRKSRFFAEFDRTHQTLALASSVVDGELSSGSPSARSRALAWCARILSSTEALEKAEEFLALAGKLDKSSEVGIAQAFLYSQKGEKSPALNTLASIYAPPARSAALMIVSHHEGSAAAVSWLQKAGLDFADLDSDGKYYLLVQLHLLAQWDAAFQNLAKVSPTDLENAPILHHMIAMTYLASAVANELIGAALVYVPLDAADFPLASDATGIDARRKAQAEFMNAVQIEEHLGLSNAAAIDEEYALWLELRDPDNSPKGRQRLEGLLRDPKTGLRFVPLGRQFSIAMDSDAVERAIDEEIALHGGTTRATALARLSLSSTKRNPKDAADYIAKYSDELARFINKKYLLLIEIDMLLRAGLFERVDRDMELLIKEGLSEEEESQLRGRIAEAHGTDPVQNRKERFEQTGSVVDLANLVDALEARKDWGRLCEYAQTLFERTRSLHDAERYAYTLSQTRKHERLVQFLESYQAILPQSKHLQFLYCWGLYEMGAVLEAQAELMKLNDYQNENNYRELQLHLGIALGDWDSLSAIVVNERQEKDNRSPQELLRAGQLALYLKSPVAKELIVAAAKKGKDDAYILATAYFLASEAGWEDDPEVSTWLTDAAELSGEDGPIQKMTLKDVLDQKPDWDRQESEVLRLLSRGEMPMFLAARSLKKSLIDFMLFPAFVNPSEADPRRRVAIPAYSGAKRPTLMSTQGAVGMDATALLSLGLLNLLEMAFNAFDVTYLPHPTLSWLFEEKRKAAFHQPSRIRDAHLIQNLLATNALERLVPTVRPDSDLSAQVGDELSQLIVEAEKEVDGDNTLRVVVRPYPVPRLTSLMQEDADLTSHEAVLCGCGPIVDKLRQVGQITNEEAKKARAYLRLQERPWPNQPQIPDGAILYLDGLAVTHFLHTGILDKLKAAGFRPIVSPWSVSETNILILYESVAAKVADVIERIRSAVHDGIVSGKVRMGRSYGIDGLADPDISSHPTVAVISLAWKCEAIIIDDRFLNQYQHVEDGTAQALMFSTLDLINTLASRGLITPDERLEYRTLLRRAGYCFIPVEDKELVDYLANSAVQDGIVIETAELKAIRESILQARMRDWLQLPKEGPWLQETIGVAIRVLRSLWKPGVEAPIRRDRSKWIWSLIDTRGWAHRLSAERRDDFLRTGQAGDILPLLAPLSDVPQEIRKDYWEWLDAEILSPLEVQSPEAYAEIVKWYRGQIAVWADKKLPTGGHDDK